MAVRLTASLMIWRPGGAWWLRENSPQSGLAVLRQLGAADRLSLAEVSIQSGSCSGQL
jgi:hypothetical protein